MVQYRIPAAEFFAAAVILVCFVIALAMINMQVTGKARSVGVLGAALLFGSTILGTLNGSVGSAYGPTALLYEVGSVIVALLAAGGLVLLAVAVGLARTARTPRGGRR